MSDTTDTEPAAQAPTTAPAKKRPGGLNGMLLADLKAMAGALGISGSGSMKKAQLVEAIKSAGQPVGQTRREEPRDRAPEPQPDRTPDPAVEASPEPAQDRDERKAKDRADEPGKEQPAPPQGGQQAKNGQQGGQPDAAEGDGGDGEGGSRRNRRRRGRDRTRAGEPAQGGTQGGNQSGNQGGSQGGSQGGNQGGNQSGNQPSQGGSQRNQGGRGEPDTTILDDDVLVPAAGILDVLDNYAFVRTSGYLPGVDDVYLSLSMVRKFGLRRGDALVGQVRQPREGERKEKFNPMVRIDSVNGTDPETARTRAEFASLTPVHPDQRLRLETAPDDLVGRVVDLAAPLGKGQRGLIVSPARAGKTSILRAIAASVTRNNPECHLMVVLVDERPEEVTDFQRSIKGEVVASTFDRPPADHAVVAELAIERAKRLVELGHDVVVLMDGLTRLGRAYHVTAPTGGRGGSGGAGGVDPGALFPSKRFFGAARKLEEGGSLTILATATADSGSALDAAILEELSDTANAELWLRRDLAEKGVVPPVDLVRSGTRAVDRLVSAEEGAILDKLRRVLAGQDDQEAADLLLERVRATQTNVELLSRIQRAAPHAI